MQERGGCLPLSQKLYVGIVMAMTVGYRRVKVRVSVTQNGRGEAPNVRSDGLSRGNALLLPAHRLECSTLRRSIR